jgi:indolepyruvate ferredoxin oxidoreductase beta subunit
MLVDKMEYEIFLTGIGGQGILSITDILCNTAVEMGFKVRGSETHGMAQRGGTVESNVRFGDVFSPLIMERASDVLIGFEPIEALRYAKFVKPDGYILVNPFPIPSPGFVLSKQNYPDTSNILSSLKEYCSHVVQIDATKIALELNMPIIQNIVMLGALSAIPDLPLTETALKSALKKQFKPKHYELNLKAVNIGRQKCLEAI